VTGHVQDLWMRPGPNGRKVRSERWGHGKRWQARWQEGGYEKARAFVSKDGAQAHLALVEVHGPFKPRPKVTFAEYAETWRRSQLHHRGSTADAAERMFRLMLDPQLGRISLVEVTRQDVQNAVIEWQAHYSPARVHIAYGYVATVFKSAVLDQIIAATPCRKISLPEKQTKRVIPLTIEQVTEIADRIAPHWRSTVIVAASSGLRIGELGGLTRDRVQDHALVVDRQLVRMTKAGPVFGPPKSSAGDRTVPIGDVAWRALSEHMAANPDNPHGFVWVGRQHGPLARGRASEAWREATEGMGLRPRSGWHDLRHFHASDLIAAGLSPRAVADRLGHKDVGVTIQVYSHLWPNDQTRATAASDETLGGL
jgi:integrase